MPPGPAGIDRALLAGVAAYRRHPYRRELVDPPAIWSDGESRLLDYGASATKPNASAMPVLFVPSLVNRAYVLDLLPDRSMLRWLGARGVRPLLLDWGWPGPAERAVGLTGAVAGRLEPALRSPGEPVVLAGYCMGGLLALAAALRQAACVRALALLATPWDFHAEQRAQAIRLGASLALFEPLLAATGTLPVDALQTLFAAVEPGAVGGKFRWFGRLDQASAAARDFVALEDWLNDGVPLAAPIAREVLSGWYRDNLPGTGQWRIGGGRVEPEALRCPTFVAVPSSDRIVAPGSALPLAARIPGRSAAPAGRRPHRHDGGSARRSGAVAAAAGLVAGALSGYL